MSRGTALRIFVGYDSKESIAYHVLSHSILRRSSIPVSIQPVMLSQLGGLYHRTRGSKESTEFSMSRFLVPHLSGYEGWSVFMDCDMLCQIDVALLLDEIALQPDKAVLLCRHDYTPKGVTKFLGQEQTNYPRKNWSSFMLMNNAKCRALTLEYVNKATGLELHRFTWLRDDEIGALPIPYNWLVGEYHYLPTAAFLHYTLGGPWFRETASCDYGDLWRAEREHMLGA